MRRHWSAVLLAVVAVTLALVACWGSSLAAARGRRTPKARFPRWLPALLATACLTLCAVVVAGAHAPWVSGKAPAGDGSWEWHSPQPQGAAIAGLAFGDAAHGVAVGAGVVMWTADGGDTWEASIPGTSSGPYAGAAQYDLTAVAMADASTGWAVGQDLYSGSPLLLKTEDGGRTWSAQDPGPLVLSLTAVAVANTATAFIVGRAHDDSAFVVRTIDGGKTWSESWSASPGDELAGVACLDARSVCAVGVQTTAAGGHRALILSTTDGGARWTRRNAGSRRAFELNAICTAGRHGYRVAGVAALVLASSDGGATWSGMRTWLSGLQGIAFADALHGIISGSLDYADYEGCSVTRNGGRAWVEAQPLGALNRYWSVNAVAFAGPGRSVVAGRDGRVAVSDDAGLHWRRVAGLDAKAKEGGWFAGASFAGTSDIWLSGQGGYIGNWTPTLAHSSDRGRTWSSTNLGIDHGWFGEVAFQDSANGWVVGFAGRQPLVRVPLALCTKDGGGSWTRHSLPVDPARDAGLFVKDADHVWLLGSRRHEADCVVHTADGGASWAWSSPPGVPADLAGISFVTHEQGWLVGSRSTGGPDTFSGVTSPALFVTRDGGASWTEQSSAVTRGLLAGVQFRDSDHGIAWGHRTQCFDRRTWADSPILMITDEGGATWRSVELPVASGAIAEAGFVDDENGWISGYTDPFTILGDPWGMPFTCVTSDGGATWHMLESGGSAFSKMQSASNGTLIAIDASAAVLESAIGGMPVLDQRGPFTSVALGSRWANTTFLRSLRAVDLGRSGVAGTAWRVDGGAWIDDVAVIVPAPADHSSDGRHVVEFHSWDRLGNTEPLRSFAISVDTRGPRCSARDKVVRHGRTARLAYRVTDELSPTVRATLTVVDGRGRVVRRLVQAATRVGTHQTWRLAGQLPGGHYVWTVTAIDLAGNPQERSGSARLIVR